MDANSRLSDSLYNHYYQTGTALESITIPRADFLELELAMNPGEKQFDYFRTLTGYGPLTLAVTVYYEPDERLQIFNGLGT